MSFKTPSQLLIRDISEELIPQILEIQIETHLSYWSESDYRDEIKRDDSIALTALYEFEKKSKREYANEVLGFIIMRLSATGEAEIYNIGVRNRFRGKGIGGKLLTEAIRRARAGSEIKCIWLEVRESNQTALDFYKNFGFTVTGQRKNFYRNPAESALLMKLEVNKERFFGNS